MKKNYGMILLFSIALFAAANVEAQINKAGWLLGQWQNKTTRGVMYERWTKANDSTFHGKSFYLNGADTVVMETIQLQQRKGTLYYVPTVKNQNQGQAVSFKLSSSSGNTLVFENPQHDFPQKISYTLVNNESLLAEISGTVNGQQKARQFPMTKANK